MIVEFYGVELLFSIGYLLNYSLDQAGISS